MKIKCERLHIEITFPEKELVTKTIYPGQTHERIMQALGKEFEWMKDRVHSSVYWTKEEMDF